MPNLPNWSTPLQRQPGWEPRFVATIEHHMAAPFSWGVSDCVTVVADVCEAITGRDPLPNRLRRYRTELAAAKVMLSLGFADTAEALAGVFPEIEPRRARRGDCGVIGQAGGPACYVILGAQAVGKGPHGPVFVPAARLQRTFAIGAL